MNFLKLSAIFLIFFIGFYTASAAPPANDNLANAATLGGAAGIVNGTTVEATRENGEESHGVLNSDTVYRTVWYQWTAPATKPVRFEVTIANFDAAMAVYTGSAPALALVTRNNDTETSHPIVEIAAQSGVTYRIVVGVSNDANAAGGPFDLHWTQTDRPSNDDLADAPILLTLAGSVAATTLGATPQASEPVFGSGRTVWYKFFNGSEDDISMTFRTTRSGPLVDTTLGVYTGAAVGALTPVVRNNDAPGGYKSRVTFLAHSSSAYWIAVDAAPGAADADVLLDWAVTKTVPYTDFGSTMSAPGEVYYDEAADITVFRPSNGVWYSLDSSDNSFRAFQFGMSSDTPVPADYDGDGRTDYAVTRDAGGLKTWYLRNSFDGGFRIVQWGLAGDKPVPGDYDADGRADLAVFRPSTNVWYIWRSSDNQFTIKLFGLAGDIPVLGDFKGTPAGADIAVFRPSNGTWYIFDGTNTIFAPFGASGDKPVPADYDFDGRTDLAVFRPGNNTWYVLQSETNEVQSVTWGLAGDVPMTGDYDNNTNDRDDFVVYRPADNVWYLLRSEGNVVDFVKFGAPGDIPVSSLAGLMQ
ncbi:MAG: VCBS repeat-containing protein [Acidobacteria bacterium]|nr:VCBS repeat-containing protein [Acidobacteriota bacterium]